MLNQIKKPMKQTMQRLGHSLDGALESAAPRMRPLANAAQRLYTQTAVAKDPAPADALSAGRSRLDDLVQGGTEAMDRLDLSRDRAARRTQPPQTTQPRSARPSSRSDAGGQTTAQSILAKREEAVLQEIAFLAGHMRQERMDFLAPFLKTLKDLLDQDRRPTGVPPGALTVEGWATLLSRWDFLMGKTTHRQRNFAIEFLQETVEMRPHWTLEPMLEELAAALELAQQDEEAA